MDIKTFQPTEYKLKCLECGKEFTEDNHLLACDEEHKPSFLRTIYPQESFEIKEDNEGMFRFSQWLPLRKHIKNDGHPVALKSENLAAKLDLDDLWIVFSGYWPEQNADMRACTFKQLEAPPVCSRFLDDPRTIVVASAGNTARAFAEICSINEIPLLLVVPEVGLDDLWSTSHFSDKVKLVAVTEDADYSDAIELSNIIAALPDFVPEGGAKNVARRDGMGTTVLAAVTESGRIPDHYFQAVGSGTGGVAAWEAAIRLAGEGHFGENHMRLHISQNYPFTPLVDAWTRGSKTLFEMDDDVARHLIQQTTAHVLSNRKPPYSIAGGVYDALVNTNGIMYSVTNEEAKAAGELFLESEGIDIAPAAKVATASLQQSVEKGLVSKKDMILLNITGGGQQRLFSEQKMNYMKPHVIVKRKEISEETVQKLFG